MSHYDVVFPEGISNGASFGPQRRTQIVTLGTGGNEERNQQWANSRRTYDAGYGIRSANDLSIAASFWEGARGRFHTFLWKDWSDWKSCLPENVPAQDDQIIGTGDGTNATFQLTKTYGSSLQPWTRNITKPVAADKITNGITPLVAVDGALQMVTTDYVIDMTTGIITFQGGSIPVADAVVTAGFTFAVKVRFDTDTLSTVLEQSNYGNIPSMPVIEVF